MPGAYWAIMTHPAVSTEFLHEIYGEVYMMGHDAHGDYQRDVKTIVMFRERGALCVSGKPLCLFLKSIVGKKLFKGAVYQGTAELEYFV